MHSWTRRSALRERSQERRRNSTADPGRSNVGGSKRRLSRERPNPSRCVVRETQRNMCFRQDLQQRRTAAGAKKRLLGADEVAKSGEPKSSANVVGRAYFVDLLKYGGSAENSCSAPSQKRKRVIVGTCGPRPIPLIFSSLFGFVFFLIA